MCTDPGFHHWHIFLFLIVLASTSWAPKGARISFIRMNADSGDPDHALTPYKALSHLCFPLLSTVRVARSNTTSPVKFEFQMQYLEHIYTKISLSVDLTFEFSWADCIFICSIWQPSPQYLLGESHLADGKAEASVQVQPQGRGRWRRDQKACLPIPHPGGRRGGVVFLHSSGHTPPQLSLSKSLFALCPSLPLSASLPVLKFPLLPRPCSVPTSGWGQGWGGVHRRGPAPARCPKLVHSLTQGPPPTLEFGDSIFCALGRGWGEGGEE